MNEKEIENLIDEQFCDYKGLICMGATDEGYVPYTMKEYKDFSEGFKRGLEILNKKIRRYEEILGSVFGAGKMIMQEKETFDKLKED